MAVRGIDEVGLDAAVVKWLSFIGSLLPKMARLLDDGWEYWGFKKIGLPDGCA
ncbi:MAG: hypothetical protein JXD19_06145 [Deltaproteobacteria bacterium]|nr:hypothetical protein [Deltaproteobacteria bacterium]